MQKAEVRSSSRALLVTAVLLPALVFYAFTALLSLNYPYYDDYDAVLGFANHLVQLHGFSERLLYFAAAQHNEYKLYLGHGLVWLELVLVGHLNFAALSLLGNVFVALLGMVLWKLFLPHVALERRLALFIPVSLLLFQYEYFETLNWPMAGLQNLPVIAFAIAGIYFLGLGTRLAFVGGLLCMLLGICASGNGFFIALVGILMLLVQRTYVRLTVWLGALAVIARIYAFHYDTAATQNPGHASLFFVLSHPHLIYLLGFLGSAGRLPFVHGSVLLGALLCAFYTWAIRRGFLLEEPAIGYCLLFVAITAVAVSGLRSGFGFVQSISSRYNVYSALLLIFAWIAVVRITGLDRASPLGSNTLYRRALLVCILFFLGADATGLRNLRHRNMALKRGMAAFRQSGGRLSPVYQTPAAAAANPNFAERARMALLLGEKLKIYNAE